MTSVGKSDLKMRQTLEEALSNAQLHAAGLETERDKLAEQLTHIKTRVILVRHQVFSCFSFYTQGFQSKCLLTAVKFSFGNFGVYYHLNQFDVACSVA